MTYLETLRRIPDDIVLAIFAHDFDEGHGEQCVCGWALRESMTRELNMPAEDVLVGLPITRCHGRFGGSLREWDDLYWGASNNTAQVENAVVDRLDEIVCRRAVSERSR